jgi:hypothetical protein
MCRSLDSRPTRWWPAALLLVVLAPTAAPAQEAATPAAPSATASAVAKPDSTVLAEARESFRQGDYDRAIEGLRAALARGDHASADLQDLYLQLIKGYVLLGNDLKFRPQGREASNLNYDAARKRIVECLSRPELRRTRPEPETDYPPEMVRLFADVRAQLFGAFRVVAVAPREATVLLDGDTLRARGDGSYLAENLMAGPHALSVAAARHQTLSEVVEISPGSTLERSYTLSHRKTTMWYATRAAVVVGAAVGVGLLVGGGEESAPTGPSALPEAPPPPSSPPAR